MDERAASVFSREMGADQGGDVGWMSPVTEGHTASFQALL